jgi:hypothetical protein
MAREYARRRKRNRHPARIVKAGSAEARKEERQAKDDIQQGRYTAIRSLGDFRRHLEKLRK